MDITNVYEYQTAITVSDVQPNSFDGMEFIWYLNGVPLTYGSPSIAGDYNDIFTGFGVHVTTEHVPVYRAGDIITVEYYSDASHTILVDTVQTTVLPFQSYLETYAPYANGFDANSSGPDEAISGVAVDMTQCAHVPINAHHASTIRIEKDVNENDSGVYTVNGVAVEMADVDVHVGNTNITGGVIPRNDGDPVDYNTFRLNPVVNESIIVSYTHNGTHGLSENLISLDDFSLSKIGIGDDGQAGGGPFSGSPDDYFYRAPGATGSYMTATRNSTFEIEKTLTQYIVRVDGNVIDTVNRTVEYYVTGGGGTVTPAGAQPYRTPGEFIPDTVGASGRIGALFAPYPVRAEQRYTVIAPTATITSPTLDTDGCVPVGETITVQWDNTGATIVSLTGTGVQNVVITGNSATFDVTGNPGEVITFTTQFDCAATTYDNTVTICCIDPTITGGTVFPDATANIPYTHTITLGGSPAFTLANLNIPGWMTATVNGSQIDITGTPTAGDVGTNIPVEFDVTNNCNTTPFASTINVLAGCTPPAITTNPVDATICQGQTNAFTVVATGSAPLTYQWRESGTDLPGETADTLTTGTAGVYDVVVTNACGTVTSTTATLTVEFPPTITSGGTFPDATVGVAYNHDVVIAGTQPFTIANIVAPAWMTVTLTGDTVNLSGTPMPGDVGTGIAVSFDITNNCATLPISDTIDVIDACMPPTGATISGNTVATLGVAENYTVTVTGTPTTPLTYTWVVTGGTIDAGQNTDTITVTPTSFPMTIDVNVSNACGNVDAPQFMVNELTTNCNPTVPIDLSCFDMASVTGTLEGVTEPDRVTAFTADSISFTAEPGLNNYEFIITDSNGINHTVIVRNINC